MLVTFAGCRDWIALLPSVHLNVQKLCLHRRVLCIDKCVSRFWSAIICVCQHLDGPFFISSFYFSGLSKNFVNMHSHAPCIQYTHTDSKFRFLLMSVRDSGHACELNIFHLGLEREISFVVMFPLTFRQFLLK